MIETEVSASVFIFVFIIIYDKDYETVDLVKLNEWMSIPDPLVEGSNLDEIVRGMTTSAGRLYTPSYNYLDVETLKELYATVYDIDLIVGALLEPPVDGGTVGPTAQCILADVFYRIRFAQLRTLRNIDLGHVICATTELDEVPFNIFQPSRYSQMVKCQDHLLDLDLSAWREFL